MVQKKYKSAFQDVRTQVSKLNAFVQERIIGMKIVQIFNKEAAEYNKFLAKSIKSIEMQILDQSSIMLFSFLLWRFYRR